MRNTTLLLVTSFLMVPLAGCDSTSANDSKVEALLNGSWDYQYSEIEYEDGEAVKISVIGNINLEASDHTFNETMILSILEPVYIELATIETAGKWYANKTSLTFKYATKQTHISFNYLLDEQAKKEFKQIISLAFISKNVDKLKNLSKDSFILSDGEDEVEYFRSPRMQYTFDSNNDDEYDEDNDNDIENLDIQSTSDFFKIEASVISPPYLNKITLDPQQGNNYSASNLFDEDPKTTWAISDVKFKEFETETEGHYPRMVGIHTIQQYPIGKLTITNGYTKDDKSWHNNARVKTFVVMGCFDDSKFADELYSGDLSDTPDPQTIILKKTGRYDYYNLIVEDYYPGEKCNDVCISEIEVYGNP